MEQSILICCSGLGMGNASRVVAIVEAIADQAQEVGAKIRCHVVTWGSGYRFLNEYRKDGSADFDLTRIEDYSLQTPILRTACTYFRNVAAIRRLVQRLKPNLLLLDSDYHFPAYFGAGCPVVYVGQAKDILERARSHRYQPATWRERITFALREKLDSGLQTLFSTVVLVPCFRATGSTSKRIQRIPLIVRKEFLQKHSLTEHKDRVGLLLSGSEIERSAFLALAEKYNLPLLSPVPSRASKLDQFEVVLIQGGLSSISECIARAKFMVVVPMTDHPEQLLNAREVEQLGLGIRSDLLEVGRFPNLLEKIEREKSRQQNLKSPVDCGGAQAAARHILDFIGLRTAPH